MRYVVVECNFESVYLLQISTAQARLSETEINKIFRDERLYISS
jgi:hypothetical protein